MTATKKFRKRRFQELRAAERTPEDDIRDYNYVLADHLQWTNATEEEAKAIAWAFIEETKDEKPKAKPKATKRVTIDHPEF